MIFCLLNGFSAYSQESQIDIIELGCSFKRGMVISHYENDVPGTKMDSCIIQINKTHLKKEKKYKGSTFYLDLTKAANYIIDSLQYCLDLNPIISSNDTSKIEFFSPLDRKLRKCFREAYVDDYWKSEKKIEEVKKSYGDPIAWPNLGIVILYNEETSNYFIVRRGLTPIELSCDSFINRVIELIGDVPDVIDEIYFRIIVDEYKENN